VHEPSSCTKGESLLCFCLLLYPKPIAAEVISSSTVFSHALLGQWAVSLKSSSLPYAAPRGSVRGWVILSVGSSAARPPGSKFSRRPRILGIGRCSFCSSSAVQDREFPKNSSNTCTFGKKFHFPIARCFFAEPEPGAVAQRAVLAVRDGRIFRLEVPRVAPVIPDLGQSVRAVRPG